MRFVLAPGHQAVFNNSGCVFFEVLAAPKSSLLLYNEIEDFIKEKTDPKDDRSYKCLFRSLLSIEKFIYRQSLADFASALLNRRPLWLVYDEYFPDPRPVVYEKQEHHDCALLLNLKHPEKPGDGVFFRDELPPGVGEQAPDSAFLLLVFSYVHMPQHCPMFSCS